MDGICPNCGSYILQSFATCPRCGAPLITTSQPPAAGDGARRVALVICLLLFSAGTLLFGSVGACMAGAFIEDLPEINQVQSASGYLATATIGLPAVALAMGCIIGIFVVLKEWFAKK